MNYQYIDTPIGRLQVIGEADGLREIRFEGDEGPAIPETSWTESKAGLEPALRQLEEYFEGKRVDFDLKLAATGTDFQQQVWRELQEIPFGRTISYGDLAGKLGRPTASRAVGAANGRNPIPIVVPCHRVIGKDGSLTGYAGGMPTKKWLLVHEGVLLG